MIEHDKFKQKYHYDPLTGRFTWKVKPLRAGTRTNAGDLAGYYNRHLDRWYVSSGHSTQIPRARAIWFWMTGEDPKNELIAHKNGNFTDDRWENLIKTNKKNQRANIQIGKLKGVSKYDDKWKSKVMIKGKLIDLGVFDTDIEASKAYNEFKLNNKKEKK